MTPANAETLREDLNIPSHVKVNVYQVSTNIEPDKAKEELVLSSQPLKFLDLSDTSLTVIESVILANLVLPSDLPLPGTEGVIWETPKKLSTDFEVGNSQKSLNNPSGSTPPIVPNISCPTNLQDALSPSTGHPLATPVQHVEHGIRPQFDSNCDPAPPPMAPCLIPEKAGRKAAVQHVEHCIRPQFDTNCDPAPPPMAPCLSPEMAGNKDKLWPNKIKIITKNF